MGNQKLETSAYQYKLKLNHCETIGWSALKMILTL